MGALGNNLATWLAGIALFVFAFDFVRGQAHKDLKLADLLAHKFTVLGVLVTAAVLFGVSAAINLPIAPGILPFVLGFLFSFLVGALKLPYKSASQLMLSLTVLFVLFVTSDETNYETYCTAYFVGMLAWKIAANFIESNKAVMNDIAPAAVYLAGQVFLTYAYSGAAQTQASDVVDAAFIASSLVNWFQRPFRHADYPFFLKRFMLCATGALIFLILVTKVILAPQYATMSILLALGFAFSFVLDGNGFRPGVSTALGALDLVRNLLVVGCITLLATRLFGNLGLIVVGSTASIAFFSQAPAIGALYIASRVFEQSFGTNHVSNVTGVNLLHSYVSAAQYFGFFTAASLMLLIKEGRMHYFETMAISVVGVVVPALANYFLHGEATASYLIALTVACLTLAIAGQKFFHEAQVNLCSSIILVSAQASAIALLTSDLIDMGNAVANPEKLKVIYVLAAIVAVGMGISWFKNKSVAEPVPVAGD